jgi:hypothetical protein
MTTSIGAAPLYVPRFYGYDSSGNPLSGGKVETYVAGSSTPLATYPTFADAIAGTNANANPVILDAAGSGAIFLQTGAMYKVIVKDSSGVVQYTADNFNSAETIGLNGMSPLSLSSDRIPFATLAALQSVTLAYALPSGTQFTVTSTPATDYTGALGVGRRVNLVSASGSTLGTITSSSYAAGVTTVNIVNDSTAPTAPLASVALGLLDYAFPMYLDPRTAMSVIKNGNQTGFAAATKVATWSVELDTNSEWSAVNNNWVCKYPGKYLVMVTGYIQDTGVSQAVDFSIFKNGAQVALSRQTTSGVASAPNTYTVQHILSCSATDTIDVRLAGTANTTIAGSIATALSISRIP